MSVNLVKIDLVAMLLLFYLAKLTCIVKKIRHAFSLNSNRIVELDTFITDIHRPKYFRRIRVKRGQQRNNSIDLTETQRPLGREGEREDPTELVTVK